MVVARTQRGWIRKLLFNGHRVSIFKIKRVLEIGYTTVKVYINATEL
jgi:hypothetical protein